MAKKRKKKSPNNGAFGVEVLLSNMKVKPPVDSSWYGFGAPRRIRRLDNTYIALMKKERGY